MRDTTYTRKVVEKYVIHGRCSIRDVTYMFRLSCGHRQKVAVSMYSRNAVTCKECKQNAGTTPGG